MALKRVGPGRYRITAAVRPKGGGNPVHKQVTVAGTLAEAKLAEADLLRELKARSLTQAYASTFGHAVDLFVANRRERGKLSASHGKMIAHVRRELGHIRLEAFADQFAAYRRHIMQAPTVYGKPRGAASVNRYTAIVRAVFNHLVGLEIIDRNPVTPVKFPRLAERSRDRVLTPEERLRLLSAIDERRPYIAPIVRYMLAVPCRTGELVGAGREQYSPVTSTVFIPDSKAGVSIVKPVPPNMAGYFASIPEGCPWLFYREADGKYSPITKQVLRKAWEHCVEASGLSDYRLHDLRHEAVTALCRMKNDPLDIASVAGWIPRTPTPMLRVYNHLDKVEAALRIVFPPEYSAQEDAAEAPLPFKRLQCGVASR